MAYEEIHNLDSLRRAIEELASLIEAPPYDVPTSDPSKEGPHIEHDARGFHFVQVERGKEFQRFTSKSADEILYVIFQQVTFFMAVAYEVRHRIPGQDHRRQIFPYQLELLQRLQPAWSARAKGTMSGVIFDDESGSRADYCVQLRRTTKLSEHEIWVEACNKFPLPKPASAP
jgi:hypothetical protein